MIQIGTSKKVSISVTHKMNPEYQLHMMIKRLVKFGSRLEKPANISVFKSKVSSDCTDKVRKLLHSDPEKAGNVVHP